MVEAVLRDIARSSKSMDASQRQFRQIANENNRSITKIIKDISTTFASQRKDSADINNAINESISYSQQTASKVDSTNGLLQESISLQSMMVSELKNIRLGIRQLAQVMIQSGGISGAGTGTGAGGAGGGPNLGLSRATMGMLAGAGVAVGGVSAVSSVANVTREVTGSGLQNPLNTTPFTGSQQEAFAKIEQAAKSAGSPDPKMTAAIAMLESAYLKSKFAQQNNPFGQTITRRQIGTEGIIGGRPAADGEFTAIYDSLESAVKHHVRRWGGRYVPDDPQSTLRNLVQGGYNTAAPHWASSVFGIYSKNARTNTNQQTASNNTSPPASQASQASQPTNTASGVTPPTSSQTTSPSGSSSGGVTTQTTGGQTSPQGQTSGGQTPPQGQQSTTTGGGGHAEAMARGANAGIAKKLQEIESAFGSKLQVTSGFRNQERNRAVGGAQNSAHTRGNAVDIKFQGGIPETLKLIEAASKAGIGGIGVYKPGSVHLDTESKRAWGENYRRNSVPQWAEGAIRAHETNKWGEYDRSARGGEGDASRVGGGAMVGAGLGGMGMGMGMGGMGMGMGYNPMAMLGMFGGGKFGAMAGIIGTLAPMIGGLIGGIGGGAQASPLQPQQTVVGSADTRGAFDFRQFSQLPEDQQTSARFFEADMNERMRRSQAIQERAVNTSARREQAEQRTAETPPMPPPRPAELGGQNVNVNNQQTTASSTTIDDWARRVYARFGNGENIPTLV